MFPMRYNVGSHPLMGFGGHGCDEVVGSEEGRNFGYVLNLEPVEFPERINKGREREESRTTLGVLAGATNVGKTVGDCD